MKKSLNIGILAHVDAGKTSLTERLLYQVGVLKQLGSVDNIGTSSATVAHLTIKDQHYYQQLMESLIKGDEAFLDKCLAKDLQISKQDFLDQLLTQTSHADFYPVYFGSALTGEGVDALCIGLEYYLSARIIDTKAPLAGTVFKIERKGAQQRICYVNITAGELKAKQTVHLYRHPDAGFTEITEKIGAIQVFQEGELKKVSSAGAGDIVCVTGLKHAQIGDCLAQEDLTDEQLLFARPTLETVITPTDTQHRATLFSLLKLFSDEDPLINVCQNLDDDSIYLQLYGEVQQQIIRDRLWREHQIAVTFSETKMIAVERLVGKGEAVHLMDLHGVEKPEFYATLGFTLEPGPIHSGVQYRWEKQKGKIPRGYHAVTEEAVHHFLQSGLHGWQVTDCIVTLTESAVCPLSIAPHFRQLTPILLQQALEQAQTQVCEPYSCFELEIPVDVMNQIMVALANVSAVIIDSCAVDAIYRIQGELFTKHLAKIQAALPSLTHGCGILIAQHGGYRPDPVIVKS